jgi:hypothetical protein
MTAQKLIPPAINGPAYCVSHLLYSISEWRLMEHPCASLQDIDVKTKADKQGPVCDLSVHVKRPLQNALAVSHAAHVDIAMTAGIRHQRLTASSNHIASPGPYITGDTRDDAKMDVHVSKPKSHAKKASRHINGQVPCQHWVSSRQRQLPCQHRQAHCTQQRAR